MKNQIQESVFIKKINAFFEKQQTILLVLWLVILLLTIGNLPLNSIFVVATSTLALLFILSSYKKLNESSLMLEKIFTKSLGFISAIALIGIMYIVLKWPNDLPKAIIGFVGLTTYIGFTQFKKKELTYSHSKQILSSIILLTASVMAIYMKYM